MELIKHRKHPSTTRHHGVSTGVKHVAWARAARWAGWGFGEALIAILIFRNTDSFAEAGLVRSAYEVAALLSLPFVASLANRFSARHLFLLALGLYPFVGLSYLLAGLFGMTLFIVLARGLNGFLWNLESSSAAAYYRRMSEGRSQSSAFGYIDTWSHLGWLGAAFAGMAVASFVPIHWLLFLIVPASLFALAIGQGAPRDRHEHRYEKAPRPSFTRWLSGEWRQWKAWNSHAKLLGGVVLFTGVIEAFVWFFVPIEAYIRGADLPLVILLSAVGVAPTLAGYTIRKLTETKDEYALVTGGLLGAALVMIGLALFPAYSWKLAASFAIGLILELFTLVQVSLSSKVGSIDARGGGAGAFESLATFGDLLAPVVLGILLDSLGFAKVAFVVAFVSAALAIVYAALMSARHARSAA